MPFELPRLYAITDRRLSRLSHAEQVARLCEGGARLVQLREKQMSPREFYREALEALKVARSRGARLIINDRADVALALDADGVHLGQDDMPPVSARSLLGAGAIVGYSTHNIAQAIEAARMPVDYVAIGPVFDTSSKENPDPRVGLEGVRRVRDAIASTRRTLSQLPLVAIGGITLESARAVLDAGADSVAVIGALLAHGADDPSGITRRTRELLQRL